MIVDALRQGDLGDLVLLGFEFLDRPFYFLLELRDGELTRNVMRMAGVVA